MIAITGMATMIERRILALSLIGVAGFLLPGHSPYTQWYAYRAKHLVVVTDEQRPGALALAEAIASAVAAGWPQSRAVAAAAKSPVEAVRLLGSGQLQVALVPAAYALDAVEGRGRFAADGKLPLRAVAVLGDDLLVVLETYARESARALARVIAESSSSGLASTRRTGLAPIPFHRGALDYYERGGG
jgi:TRAP-type uncharacterized transport system substrate-binding protein